MAEPLDEKVSSILASLKPGKGLYDNYSATFRKHYLINGQTLETWEKEFKLRIPSDLNPGTIRELGVKLMELHQGAIYRKALADAAVQSLTKASESQYRDRFTALVAEYSAKEGFQRLPASTTLSTLARSGIDDLESAVAAAQVAVSFWREVLEHLSFCRKVLDTASISLSVEARLVTRA